jgi:oligopeptide transport system substrate-binding protein
VPFGEMPVGNGPFKMSEPWKHNQFIKVERNENYYGDAAYLDGVEFKIFKDPETAYTEFEAGTLDFTQIGEGKINDAVAKYGESPDGYTVNPTKQVLLGAETSTYYLIMNNENEYLKNKDLRRAISLAINRQAICDTVFDGTRDPADSILPPALAGYKPGAWPIPATTSRPPSRPSQTPATPTVRVCPSSSWRSTAVVATRTSWSWSRPT